MGRIQAREKLTERFEFKVSPSMLAAVRDTADARGVDMSEVARAGIEREINGASGICLEIADETRGQLESLARTLRYRNVAHYLEDLALASLKMKPREIQDFLSDNLAADGLPPRPNAFAAADEYARRRMAEDKATKQRKEGAA